MSPPVTRVASSRCGAVLVLLLGAIAALVPAAAPAQTPAPQTAARTALFLSAERLSVMRSVMASKWQTRSPVEDLPQERAVIATARAAARERGLREAGVAAVFVAEIDAAKVVELGWGNEWLLHGFPADEPVPDLAQIRAKLAGLTPRIADALAGLGDLRCRRGARAALLRDSRRLVRTRFVTNVQRTALVGALLEVRGTQSCP